MQPSTVRRTAAQNAQLALLLEVASTPKPGNVDRLHEYSDLRFEQFLAGAVGALAGFERAAAGDPIGPAFEESIAGMSQQRGGNTQFGAILLITPLLAASSRDSLTPQTARTVVEETTVEDTVAFLGAFEHVDVAVDPPPDEFADLDVRKPETAMAAVREREMTLGDLMEASSERDGIAAEWTTGFSRTFDTAAAIESASGPVTDRAAAVFIDLLAAEIDPFVRIQHDTEIAREVKQRAQAVRDGNEEATALAEQFVEREINPGTTADIVAGGLFVALERGQEV